MKTSKTNKIHTRVDVADTSLAQMPWMTWLHPRESAATSLDPMTWLNTPESVPTTWFAATSLAPMTATTWLPTPESATSLAPMTCLAASTTWLPTPESAARMSSSDGIDYMVAHARVASTTWLPTPEIVEIATTLEFSGLSTTGLPKLLETSINDSVSSSSSGEIFGSRNVRTLDAVPRVMPFSVRFNSLPLAIELRDRQQCAQRHLFESDFKAQCLRRLLAGTKAHQQYMYDASTWVTLDRYDDVLQNIGDQWVLIDLVLKEEARHEDAMHFDTLRVKEAHNYLADFHAQVRLKHDAYVTWLRSTPRRACDVRQIGGCFPPGKWQ
jgi:hypothetical protein